MNLNIEMFMFRGVASVQFENDKTRQPCSTNKNVFTFREKILYSMDFQGHSV